jgi:hypothetical protein
VINPSPKDINTTAEDVEICSGKQFSRFNEYRNALLFFLVLNAPPNSIFLNILLERIRKVQPEFVSLAETSV